jgi:hypothetical protein
VQYGKNCKKQEDVMDMVFILSVLISINTFGSQLSFENEFYDETITGLEERTVKFSENNRNRNRHRRGECLPESSSFVFLLMGSLILVRRKQ